MKSPAELTELFRARGLKVTPQRQCVFRLLDGEETHPSADVVYARARAEMPTISLRTVYQTLNDLADMGEIHALDLGTGAARFDPNTGPHHHLVCTECGRVRDVHADVADIRLPASATSDFTVAATEIVFRGRCADCTGSARTGHARTDHPATDPNAIEKESHG